MFHPAHSLHVPLCSVESRCFVNIACLSLTLHSFPSLSSPIFDYLFPTTFSLSNPTSYPFFSYPHSLSNFFVHNLCSLQHSVSHLPTLQISSETKKLPCSQPFLHVQHPPLCLSLILSLLFSISPLCASLSEPSHPVITHHPIYCLLPHPL